MIYADYHFYRSQFHGDMSEADFEKYSKKASDFIRGVTFGRITPQLMSDSDSGERIRSACCECADILHFYAARNGITQQKVGDYSVTYSSADTVGNSMYNAVKAYLSGITADGTGIMYRGG